MLKMQVVVTFPRVDDDWPEEFSVGQAIIIARDGDLGSYWAAE
jgi:hypothetical protein